MNDQLEYNLEHHIVDCEDRYQRVIKKLDNIDDRMERLENLIEELKVLVVKR